MTSFSASLEESQNRTCGLETCTQRFQSTELITDEKGKRYVWNMNTSARSARYFRVQLESHVVAVPVPVPEVIDYCANVTWGLELNLTTAITQVQGVDIVQSNGYITWSFEVVSQNLVQNEKDAVTQKNDQDVTSTGTLVTKLDGATTLIEVRSSLDQSFDTKSDLVIGTTTIPVSALTSVKVVTIPNAKGILQVAVNGANGNTTIGIVTVDGKR